MVLSEVSPLPVSTPAFRTKQRTLTAMFGKPVPYCQGKKKEREREKEEEIGVPYLFQLLVPSD